MRNLSRLTNILFVAILFATVAFAQEQQFNVGEKVEYKASGYPEVWEVGTVVKLIPSSNQVLIQMKPTEFYPNGFERAFAVADVRRITARPTNEPSASTNNNERPRASGNAARTGRATVADEGGTGLLTAQEVISYLRTRIGDDPWKNPQREQLLRELAAMIKRRGTNFRYAEGDTEFMNVAGKYGLLASDAGKAIDWNYGTPATLNWLTGTWSMIKVGAAVDYVRNNRVYRQGEIGATAGSLIINKDHTYVWNSRTGQSSKGTWREATEEEMKYQGGAGIVLQKAKGGYDWIVTKVHLSGDKEPGINVAQVESRSVKEYGTRSGSRK